MLKWPTIQSIHPDSLSFPFTLMLPWYRWYSINNFSCHITFPVSPTLNTPINPLWNRAWTVLAHWGYWHLLPKGSKSLFKVLWELHHSIGNKCMVVHVTVMDSSQLSTSWSPCPERALTSSIVIGWVAAAMMSSILNRDFISMRLIVQGMSLKKSEKKEL